MTQTTKNNLVSGPPLRGQPLSIKQAAEALSELHGVTVAPITVRQATRRFRHSWEGRTSDLDPIDPAKVGLNHGEPKDNELRCTWMGQRDIRWGTSPDVYIVDSDPANLENFKVNLPNTGLPGRKIGSSDVRVPKRGTGKRKGSSSRSRSAKPTGGGGAGGAARVASQAS